jgi:hypothetical protein
VSAKCPTTGKVRHPTYAAALDALDRLDAQGLFQSSWGEVYTCKTCGLFHVTAGSRASVLRSRKGRGKSQRRRPIGR